MSWLILVIAQYFSPIIARDITNHTKLQQCYPDRFTFLCGGDLSGQKINHKCYHRSEELRAQTHYILDYKRGDQARNRIQSPRDARRSDVQTGMHCAEWMQQKPRTVIQMSQCGTDKVNHNDQHFWCKDNLSRVLHICFFYCIFVCNWSSCHIIMIILIISQLVVGVAGCH